MIFGRYYRALRNSLVNGYVRMPRDAKEIFRSRDGSALGALLFTGHGVLYKMAFSDGHNLYGAIGLRTSGWHMGQDAFSPEMVFGPFMIREPLSDPQEANAYRGMLDRLVGQYFSPI